MKKILVGLATNPAVEITGMNCLFDLQKTLVRHGYEIHIVTPNVNPAVNSKEHYYRRVMEWKNWKDWFGRKENESGIKFHVFDIDFVKNIPIVSLVVMRIFFVIKMLQCLKEEEFDAIHEYFSFSLLIPQAALYRLFFKKKIFCTLCSSIDGKMNTFFLTLSLKRKWVDRVFFFDQHSLNQFKDSLLTGRMTWLPPGCNYDDLYTEVGLQTTVEELRKALRCIKGDQLILFLGPLVERKGPFELTEAFKNIARLHKDALLVFATPPVNKKVNFHNRNKQMINRLAGEFAGRIRFLEGVHNVAALMTLADIIAIPLKTISGTLTYPLTLLESLRSGKAIVASDIIGNREIIQDGVNGMLYSNREDLANKLHILLNSPDLRKGLGDNARKASSRFELENCVRTMSAFYDVC